MPFGRMLQMSLCRTDISKDDLTDRGGRTT
jgi:hypothetical protein